jgi:hypothetical protein
VTIWWADTTGSVVRNKSKVRSRLGRGKVTG